MIVRMELDAWQFPAATDAMTRASSVIAERDDVAATAAAAGLQAPARLESAYEDAATRAPSTPPSPWRTRPPRRSVT